MSLRKVLAKWLRQRADQLDPPRSPAHPVFYSYAGPYGVYTSLYPQNETPWTYNR